MFCGYNVFMKSPHVIIGLGNPEEKYSKNRHNVGWMCLNAFENNNPQTFVDISIKTDIAIIKWGRLNHEDIALVYPQTFMNNTGLAISYLQKNYGILNSQILVIHDDLDLPLGRLQLKQGGGTGGHNGLKSISESLQTLDFKRLRIGVNRPPVGTKVLDYVLGDFYDTELKLKDECIKASVYALNLFLSNDLATSMNKINTKNFIRSHDKFRL